MSGHRPFSELRDKLRADPERAARIDAMEIAIENALALAEMRRSRGVTQKQLAETMHVSQANISRIEHGEDAQLSTIQRYISALGGHLELRAIFPDRIEFLQASNVER
jgi:transcriptional regulator with XRE-family HTH domain